MAKSSILDVWQGFKRASDFFLSVQDWHKANAQKLEHLLSEEEFATDEEAEKLGKKNVEAYLLSWKIKREKRKSLVGRRKVV